MKFLIAVFAFFAFVTTTIAGEIIEPAGEVLINNERPFWVENPGDGVSASALTHVNGRAAQEKLAIDRAKRKIIERFGLTIKLEEIDPSTFKTHIKSEWRDAVTDELWVWVELIPGKLSLHPGEH